MRWTISVRAGWCRFLKTTPQISRIHADERFDFRVARINERSEFIRDLAQHSNTTRMRFAYPGYTEIESFIYAI